MVSPLQSIRTAASIVTQNTSCNQPLIRRRLKKGGDIPAAPFYCVILSGTAKDLTKRSTQQGRAEKIQIQPF
jgi:hypothetical protein